MLDHGDEIILRGNDYFYPEEAGPSQHAAVKMPGREPGVQQSLVVPPAPPAQKGKNKPASAMPAKGKGKEGQRFGTVWARASQRTLWMWIFLSPGSMTGAMPM